MYALALADEHFYVNMFADRLHVALAAEDYIRFWPRAKTESSESPERSESPKNKNTREDSFLLVRLHLVYPQQPCAVECVCCLYDASDAGWTLNAAHKTWIHSGSRKMVLFEVELQALPQCASTCVVGFLPGPLQREPVDVHVVLNCSSTLIDMDAPLDVLMDAPMGVPMDTELMQFDMFPALHGLQRSRLAAKFMSAGFKELMERAWAPERVARGLIDPDH